MPDQRQALKRRKALKRRQALSTISAALREQVAALQALGEPRDHDLPIGMRLLLDAIDRVDLAAGADLDRRAAA